MREVRRKTEEVAVDLDPWLYVSIRKYRAVPCNCSWDRLHPKRIPWRSYKKRGVVMERFQIDE